MQTVSVTVLVTVGSGVAAVTEGAPEGSMAVVGSGSSDTAEEGATMVGSTGEAETVTVFEALASMLGSSMTENGVETVDDVSDPGSEGTVGRDVTGGKEAWKPVITC